MHTNQLANELLAKLIEPADRPWLKGVEPQIFWALKGTRKGQAVEFIQIDNESHPGPVYVDMVHQAPQTFIGLHLGLLELVGDDYRSDIVNER